MRKTYCLFTVLLSILILFAGCASAPRGYTPGQEPGDWSGSTLVVTPSGPLLGHDDQSDTLSWKGVPYAAPPVGDLRWKAPADPEPWTEVLEAKRFASPCTQYSPVRRGKIIGCEDCLYLNIWRPDTAEKDLPVYVWIHGGGNSIGSADMVQDYYGYNLASRGSLLFVSINYRLGPFGWFTHPALRTGNPGDEKDDSGNYGTLDIIQALKWIQTNIEYFGGDPGRVTIAGESAGGFNVTSLLISPEAEDLFHRAVSQSGGLRASSPAEGDTTAAEALKKMLEADGQAARLVGRSMKDEEIAAYLRSKPAEDILSVFDGGFGGMLGLPGIFTDGAVIPADGYAAFSDGSYPSKIPLILGSNADELRLFLTFSPEYRKKDELFDLVARIGSDNWKAESVDKTARVLTALEDPGPVFVYHFRWGSPDENGAGVMPGNWSFELGATHTLEIPFFFGHKAFTGRAVGSLIYSRKNNPGREDLSAAMMDYLINFVHTGNPGSVKGLRWLPWSNEPGGPKTLVFDAGYEEAEIFMIREEYTTEGILASYSKSADPRLFEEARNIILGDGF